MCDRSLAASATTSVASACRSLPDHSLKLATASAGIIGDSSARQVLLFDRPGNHLQRRANGLLHRVGGVIQEEASLLLTDGSVVTWHGDSPDYAAWAERHSAGEDDPYPPGIEEIVTEWESANTAQAAEFGIHAESP